MIHRDPFCSQSERSCCVVWVVSFPCTIGFREKKTKIYAAILFWSHVLCAKKHFFLKLYGIIFFVSNNNLYFFLDFSSHSFIHHKSESRKMKFVPIFIMIYMNVCTVRKRTLFRESQVMSTYGLNGFGEESAKKATNMFWKNEQSITFSSGSNHLLLIYLLVFNSNFKNFSVSRVV